ncbi:hypothetical protein [Acidithiobacillus sp.]|uniref:hypothetical protein n=1 Tax=Acidithiobacillus sp. TaxID=1872118 RepID=UPI003D05AAFD
MHSLGILIRPTGSRLPILRMGVDGTIEVQGAYVTFETTIRAAIRSGYRLEDATLELQDFWDRTSAASPSTIRTQEETF